MGRLKISRLCERCNTPFFGWTGNHPNRFCSVKCREIPAAERFWSQVVKAEGCWKWTGRVDKDGYPVFYPIKGHRFSYELHYGPIPEGLWVLHHCDNPSCTRPDHLYAGTSTDNIRDKTMRGRQRGENHGRAIVNEITVQEIRQRYASGTVTQVTLAAEYGLKQSTVSQIILRKCWKHV